eukprot:235483-Pyramimonas_sp.AAC.1
MPGHGTLVTAGFRCGAGWVLRCVTRARDGRKTATARRNSASVRVSACALQRVASRAGAPAETCPESAAGR